MTNDKQDNQQNQLDVNILTSALQFWKKIYDEKEVIIRFTKKNGEERLMRASLDFTKIPEKDKPKNVNIQQILKLLQQNKIMHVYDLDKKSWRSVPFDRIQYMDTKTRRYYTKKRK